MKKTLILLAVLAGVLFLAWRLLFGGWTAEWRQRLTVTVETPAGAVSGAAVTEVTMVDTRGALVLVEASGVQVSSIRGEAVAVEVLPGRWLFALLSGQDGDGSWQRDAAHWVYPAYSLARKENGDQREFWERMRIIRRQPYDTPVPLPPEGWPLMVTFGDIADPATVRRVDPNDLAATFGPGVSLKALTLEITRAKVTKGRVEGVLGSDFFREWARLYKDALAGRIGNSFLATLPGQLTRNNFVQENLP